MTKRNDPSASRRLALIGTLLAGAVNGAVRALVSWLLDT